MRGAVAARCFAVLTAAVLTLALTVLGQEVALSVLGVGLGLVISVPQLVHLWRVRGTDASVSGVSLVEYAVVIAAQAGWVGYWTINAQWLVAAGSAWGLLARVLTLVLLTKQARRSSGDPCRRGSWSRD